MMTKYFILLDVEINTTTLAIGGEADSYFKSTLTLYNVTKDYPTKFECRAMNDNGEVQAEMISFKITGEF
jgi:hypothetical protein